MDSEWMYKVLSDYNLDNTQRKVPQLFQNLINTHQQYVQSSAEKEKSDYEAAKSNLIDALNSSDSNKYTPSTSKIAEKIELLDLMGLKLLNAIEIRLANSMPQDAQADLKEILNKINKKQKHVAQSIAGLNGLGIQSAEVPEGQVQINYIIPTNYKESDYQAFIKANKEMLYIIDTMNLVVGKGASETKIVSTRSSSLLVTLLSNVDTIETLLDIVKTIMEIIGITATAAIAIKKLEEAGYSQKVIDAAIEDKAQIFDRKIDELKKELHEEYKKNNNNEENDNTHIQINNSVNLLINSFQDGIQIEAIASDKNTKKDQAVDSINKLTVEINQLSHKNSEGVKSLEYQEVDIEAEDE